jgi:hypothetical protein
VGIGAVKAEERIPPRQWVDDSAWPLLRVMLPPTQSDADVLEYLELLRSYRSRRQPYAILLDTSRSLGFSATQRKLQGEYIREGRAVTKITLRAIAFVADSALRRGALTAIFWIATPPAPHQIFARAADAEVWLRTRLDPAWSAG